MPVSLCARCDVRGAARGNDEPGLCASAGLAEQNRAKNAEAFNSLKIELQNNIQLLEQQLEEMRATYQLNTEVCLGGRRSPTETAAAGDMLL